MDNIKLSFPYITSWAGSAINSLLRSNHFQRTSKKDLWNTEVYDNPLTQPAISEAEKNIRSEEAGYSRWKYDQICQRVFMEGTLLANYELRKARIRGGGLDITHNNTGLQAPRAIYRLIRKEWFYALFDAYLRHNFYGVSLVEFHLDSDGRIIIAYPVERGFIDTHNKEIRTPEDALKAKYTFGRQADDFSIYYGLQEGGLGGRI